MFKFTFKFGAVAVGCLVIASSAVLAQDAASQRRERLRKLGEAAAGIAVDQVAESASKAGAVVISGHVVILGKPVTEAVEVNNGGLIIVRVPDSGSRPPKDIKVEAGKQFVRLGQVQGVGAKNTKPKSGGGYTWILLKPTSEGAGSIVVTFTPNDGSEGVKREYNVLVTAPEKSSDAK